VNHLNNLDIDKLAQGLLGVVVIFSAVWLGLAHLQVDAAHRPSPPHNILSSSAPSAHNLPTPANLAPKTSASTVKDLATSATTLSTDNKSEAAANDGTVSSNGWLEGTATLWPTCAAQAQHLGQTCSTPYKGTLRATNSKTGATKDFDSDDNGHFRVELAAGSYTIATIDQPTTSKSNGSDIQTSKTTHQDFTFDTGMR